MTIVWTDGSCWPTSGGPGGWAWAVEDGLSGSGHELSTTNNRMELRAALEAVQALSGPLVVVSDSAYVVNCFLQRWWFGWERRGWVNSKGKAIDNRDLWEPLIEVSLRRGVEFRHVKGHSGIPMNELVDRMAGSARKLAKAQLAALGPTAIETIGVDPFRDATLRNFD